MGDPVPGDAARGHVVIAGTGRAGTSFLVRFLAECGLDTGGERSGWHDRADAGLETDIDQDPNLPHVVKDPWFHLYCRDLDLRRVPIEALVVPTRDLTMAASSRVLQERLSIAETAWIDRPPADVYARTPGGIVYSLSVADQKRLLAVGFHDLVQWSLEEDIPLILLSFPRLVDDAEYLVERLQPVLSGRDRDECLRAHGRVADADRVRLRDRTGESEESRTVEEESRADLDLDREAAVRRVHELQQSLEAHERSVEELRRRLADTQARLDAAEARASEASERSAQLEAAAAELDAIHGSTIWRFTRPVRAVRTAIGRDRPG